MQLRMHHEGWVQYRGVPFGSFGGGLMKSGSQLRLQALNWELKKLQREVSFRTREESRRIVRTKAQTNSAEKRGTVHRMAPCENGIAWRRFVGPVRRLRRQTSPIHTSVHICRIMRHLPSARPPIAAAAAKPVALPLPRKHSRPVSFTRKPPTSSIWTYLIPNQRTCCIYKYPPQPTASATPPT